MPTGIGGSGCVCGAVTGGVLALGYFFGRTLTKKTPLGSPEHMAQCVSFTGEVAENEIGRSVV